MTPQVLHFTEGIIKHPSYNYLKFKKGIDLIDGKVVGKVSPTLNVYICRFKTTKQKKKILSTCTIFLERRVKYQAIFLPRMISYLRDFTFLSKQDNVGHSSKNTPLSTLTSSLLPNLVKHGGCR